MSDEWDYVRLFLQGEILAREMRVQGLRVDMEAEEFSLAAHRLALTTHLAGGVDDGP